VVGAVGGVTCSHKNGGPLNVNVELLSPTGDLISSVLTSSAGSYLFKNILPGMKVCIVLFCYKTNLFVLYVETSSKKTSLKLPTYPKLPFNKEVVCKKS
jgi:hypothetical protein